MVIVYGNPIEKWKCIFKECEALCCHVGREATGRDLKRISEGTGLKPGEFADLNEKGGLFTLKGKEGRCIFLQEDFGCQLHAKGIKPILCQMYPFRFDGLIYSDDVILKIKIRETCPGLGRDKDLDEDFEIKIEELGNKFVRDIRDYLRLKAEGNSFEDILDKL
ncbi:MAG: YkgJ family cysteine cluster protein [Candidatus Hydrothermarchaeales archaeon]